MQESISTQVIIGATEVRNNFSAIRFIRFLIRCQVRFIRL